MDEELDELRRNVESLKRSVQRLGDVVSGRPPSSAQCAHKLAVPMQTLYCQLRDGHEGECMTTFSIVERAIAFAR